MSTDQTHPDDALAARDEAAGAEPALGTAAGAPVLAPVSGVPRSSASAVAYFEPHAGDDLELELDLPPRKDGPSLPPATSEPAPTAGIHQPRVAVGPAWQRPAPNVHPSRDVARFFLDEGSGVLRVWVVALMITICVAATLTGRLMRMRAEAIREAEAEAAR